VVEAVGLLLIVSLKDVDVPIEIVISGSDAHTGHFLAVATDGEAAEQRLFAEGSVVVVYEEQARRRVGGHKDIGPAVFVDVECDSCKTVGSPDRFDTRTLGNVGVCAVAIVSIERMRGNRQASRAAIDSDALVLAGGNLDARFGRSGYVELHIIGDEKIEMAISVVIEKSASCTKAISGMEEARRRSDVGECAVSVVAIETVVAVVGEEKIFETIIVVVAHANAIGPAGIVQSGLCRDISECPVAIVVVEVIAGAGWTTRKSAATKEKDVHPAIVVVVEEGAAAAHRFDDVGDLTGCAVNDGL